MTIAITSSGIALDGPLVAGEKVAVSVSGITFAEGSTPTLALLARFPDALLASVELAEDAETPGTWTGELDTATKQTALFFATARADERRDAALELVSGRVSIARLTVPMANSALCPKPDGSPFASPVYVPVPGPPGTGGDPYDQAPEMDGEASAGTTEKYARGDHRHPTDESRASTEDATLYAASFGDWVASGLPVGFHVGQTSWNAGNWSIEIVNSTGTPGSTTILVAGEETATTLSAPHTPLPTEPTTYADLTFSRSPSSYVLGTQADKPLSPTIPDLAAIRSGAAAGATAVQPSALATVATSGSYNDLTNKPNIPGPAPVTSVNGDTGDVLLYGNTLVMSSSDSTLVSEAINAAQSDATTALSGVSAKATATAVAPAFSTSSTYAVGAYVTHEGLLYKCTTAVTTAGAWNSTKWTAVAVTDEMGAGTPLPFDAECEYVTVPVGAYILPEVQTISPEVNLYSQIKISSPPSASAGFFIGNWSGAATGSTQIVFNAASTCAVINGNNATTVSSSGVVGQLGVVALQGNKITIGATTSSSAPNVAARAPLDIGVGACVLATGEVDASTITGVQTDIASFVIRSGGAATRDFVPVRIGTVGYLYDKVSGRLFGSAVGSIPLVPGPDKATPTITTPGRIVELTPAIRYSFASPTPSVSGTSATVACEDRAINDFAVATGITSLTITPPAAVTGRARDFFCRVTLTDSSLPTVTLSGETIDIGQSEINGMTQGVNLLMFTEIASGHWLASRRSAS